MTKALEPNGEIMLIQEIKKLQLQKELVSIRRGCSDEDQTGIFEFINNEVAIFLYIPMKVILTVTPFSTLAK
jgi:hypothetical protein